MRSKSTDRAGVLGRGPGRHPAVSILGSSPAGAAPDAILTGARGRLGDVLQAEGRISHEQAVWAAEVAARDGARIGSVLVAAGLVRRASSTACSRACATARTST